MKLMLDYLTISAVCVFVVDVSGWTETWRGWLAAAFKVQRLRRLRPLDCSLCLTWWSCLGWAIGTHSFTLGAVAGAALAAALTPLMLQAWNCAESWAVALLSRAIMKSENYLTQKENEKTEQR